MKTSGGVVEEFNPNDLIDNEKIIGGADIEPLRCWDCNTSFVTRDYLYDHLFHHIKQPQVSLTRVQLPPLKLTLKLISKSGNDFEIVSPSLSPTSGNSPFNLADFQEDENKSNSGSVENENQDGNEEEKTDISFSPSFAEVECAPVSPTNSDGSGTKNGEFESVPGAEPTPPPDPSPDYPKIRIKTTGLLKEPLTITEITDDDKDLNQKKDDSWSNSISNMEDPLKLPGSDDILSLFSNNERAKDFGFNTSDSEFIPLDRLDDRNRNALQLYNPPNQLGQQNPLSSIAGLPMEALAQQVSRLQPHGNGMHQQNVLINIQQFPQAPPPQPPYQPPHMFHHPPQPMYHQPYQPYQPNPMYYPAAPNFAQHMPPPQPQMPPMSQPQPMGQPPQIGPPPSSQPQQTQPYRQPLAPRQPTQPRQMAPQQRMPVPGGPRQPVPGPRQPVATRQRAPMIRPRGGGPMTVRGGIRPRMPVQQNGGQARPSQQGVKRTQEQAQQAKKKRLDVLTPDKDDEDCQVICMQPKNTDGGLPQISSVQGGTEQAESSIMHLSDSITLSVRNPQPRPQSPKKSDAKAVANILATRGITVTATAKPKEKAESKSTPTLPTSLNLNGAVSIIPSAKSNSKSSSSPTNQESPLPTVDLTDDTTPANVKQNNGPSKQQPNQRQGLPFKCDLCPAQYPNAISLSKHRQNYHKTNSGMCEIGVPLVNLKQPGIFQKLSSVGIFNYIPLPASGPDGMFALPIINGRMPGNVSSLGCSTMLTLGPVRNIPKAAGNVSNGTPNNTNKQGNNQK